MRALVEAGLSHAGPHAGGVDLVALRDPRVTLEQLVP